MILIRKRVPGFVNRVLLSPAGLWVPDSEIEVVPRIHNVLARIHGPDGPRLGLARNIVTDAGDLYYAQALDDWKNSAGSPTNTFGVAELGTAGTPAKGADRSDFTPIAGTEKASASGYWKRNDVDANNTGAGVDVITHKFEWTPADGNWSNITHGWITNASPGASEPILTGFAFSASFNKDGDTALDVFVNHTINGV